MENVCSLKKLLCIIIYLILIFESFTKTNVQKNFIKKYYEIVSELRDNNIPAEIYLDQNKNLKKQLQYADRKKLDIAIICGENELKDEKLTIKKLNSSKENDQLSISRNEFINEIKKLI